MDRLQMSTVPALLCIRKNSFGIASKHYKRKLNLFCVFFFNAGIVLHY